MGESSSGVSWQRLSATPELVKRMGAKKGSQSSAVFPRKEKGSGEDAEES